MNMKSILVTGSAGFIGANLVLRLLESPAVIPGLTGNLRIVGLDSMNDYYASALERDFGFTPKITLREGLRHFAEWYKEYYK